MYKKIHTHYDNLKVAPDAPIEVIRAAYRSLCKKYHPDHNTDNVDAHRIMSLINASYKVLSNPAKRREHDEWIATQKIDSASLSAPYPPKPHRAKLFRFSSLLWFAVIALGLVAAGLWTQYLRNHADIIAPPANAESWPPYSQYLSGHPIINQAGNGMAKIDNLNNTSAVWVELRRNAKTKALRTFYISQHADFTLFNLDQQPYHLRYRHLNGGTWQEAHFQLDNITTLNHIRLKTARHNIP